MHIAKKKGSILIPDPIVRDLGIQIKKAFPDVKWTGSKSKCWRVYATNKNILEVNRLFGSDLETNTITNDLPIDITKFKTEPFPHQITALKQCGGRKFFGYLLTMGLGKTKITIDDINLIGGIDAVLVCCPKSVLHVWKEELLTHSHIDPEQITVWDDIPTKINHDQTHWFIINYDILIYDRGFNAAYDFLVRNSINAIVLDESTAIKNFKSQRYKAVMRLKEISTYRRILTGTPIDSPIDLYGQFSFLDESCVEFRSYYSFRNHYCEMGGFKNKQVLFVKDMKGLKRIVQENAVRMKLEDAIDLPEKIHQIRNIQLDKDTLDLYQRVEEKLVIDYQDGKISMKAVEARLTKLQQITGGVVIGEDGPIRLATPKLDETCKVLKEAERLPALIWAQYTAEIEMIKDRLEGEGYRVLTLTGQTKDRAKVNRDFESGGADILILQNQAGAMGLTLNAASLSIYYSNSTSSILRQQSEYRNYRIGQFNSVLYVDIMTKDLIDKSLYHVVKRKRGTTSTIVDSDNPISELLCEIKERLQD